MSSASPIWPSFYGRKAIQTRPWRTSHEALRLAQEVSHAFSLAAARAFAAIFHQMRREWQAAQARAEETLDVSTEQGFQLWLADGHMIRGWALIQQGQGQEGLTQLRQGLDMWPVLGLGIWRTHQLGMLAEVQGDLEQAAAGRVQSVS